MKKIPTIFQRDWEGDRSRVLDIQHPDCTWVFDGEGVATRKLDGTSCKIHDGAFYRRRELKAGQKTPDGFVSEGTDQETGKTVGWVPVGEGPEDKWHREAFGVIFAVAVNPVWPDGTYELVGPNVQGNPERLQSNHLVLHGAGLAGPIPDVPRTFDGLREYLADKDIEGIVFHHPDGRMAKIKLRDFGLKRRPRSPAPMGEVSWTAREALACAYCWAEFGHPETRNDTPEQFWASISDRARDDCRRVANELLLLAVARGQAVALMNPNSLRPDFLEALGDQVSVQRPSRLKEIVRGVWMACVQAKGAQGR